MQYYLLLENEDSKLIRQEPSDTGHKNLLYTMMINWNCIAVRTDRQKWELAFLKSWDLYNY